MLKWLLVVVLATRFAAGRDDPSEEIFHRAVALQAAGEMEEAVTQYQAFLRLRPDRVGRRG